MIPSSTPPPPTTTSLINKVELSPFFLKKKKILGGIFVFIGHWTGNKGREREMGAVMWHEQ